MAPRISDSDTAPDSGASASDAANRIYSISSPGLGADFRFIRFIAFGRGADSDESTESKVLALGEGGATLDSSDSLDSFDALDSEAPERPGGGTGSEVQGALSIH